MEVVAVVPGSETKVVSVATRAPPIESKEVPPVPCEPCWELPGETNGLVPKQFVQEVFVVATVVDGDPGGAGAGAVAIELNLSPPPRVIAPAGSPPVSKTTVPALARI